MHSFVYTSDFHSSPTRRSSDLSHRCVEPGALPILRQRAPRGQNPRLKPRHEPGPGRGVAQDALAIVPPAALLEGGEQRRQVEPRSEEHTSELQSRENLVCSLLL